jgi:hypothetical protein
MKLTDAMEMEFFTHLLQNPEYLHEYIGLLKEYTGSNYEFEWIRKQLVTWKDSNYEGLPPIEYWKAIAENNLGEKESGKILLIIENLISKKPEYEDIAKDQFLDFITTQKLERAYNEGQQLYQQTLDVNYWMAKMWMGLREAEKITTGSKSPSHNWLEEKEIRARNRGTVAEGLRLGIQEMDEQFTFRRGTLSAFLGPYKRYKSIMLHHCGFAAMLQMNNVLHVTFENTLQQTGDRYDSRFTHVDYKRMCKNLLVEDELEQMEKVYERMGNFPNRLEILPCIPYTDTVRFIEKTIDKLSLTKGWGVDVLIVDYLNIVGIEDKRIAGDDYKRIEVVVWELQNLGKSRNFAVISACQTVKGAEEREHLKKADTAGSVGILRACDNLIAINQTKEEFGQGNIRLSPLLFRDDEIVHEDVTMHHDLSRMCVSEEGDNLWGAVDFA